MGKDDMATVSRVPKGKSGTTDAVQMLTKCSVVNFTVNGKNEVTGLGSQNLANCKLLASFENGTVSVSIRGANPHMVTVRLDEMMTLLKEAADFSMENRETGDLHETKSDQPTEG